MTETLLYRCSACGSVAGERRVSIMDEGIISVCCSAPATMMLGALPPPFPVGGSAAG